MFGDSSQKASATTGIAVSVISQLSKETSGIVASRARIAKRGVTMRRLELIANHIRPSEIISDNARTFGAIAKWIKK